MLKLFFLVRKYEEIMEWDNAPALVIKEGTYHSLLVAAQSESDARAIAVDADSVDSKHWRADASCEMIGTASENIQRGIIHKDENEDRF